MTSQSAQELSQGPSLHTDTEGVALSAEDMELRADFLPLLPRIRPGRLQKELLVRAAKIKRLSTTETPTVFDATAGLGEDSFLLAAAGFSVTLCERDSVIAALLQDALRRAAEQPQLQDIVAHMHLVMSDSIQVLEQLQTAPDVVYLDPMFPRRRKSAAVKKKFQVLHQLEAPCADAIDLLQTAFHANPRKIVIKRPAKGPLLADVKPSYSLSGKSVRYDVIVPSEVPSRRRKLIDE